MTRLLDDWRTWATLACFAACGGLIAQVSS